MLERLRRRAVTPRDGRPSARTPASRLIETLVAIVLIGVVMAAMSSFLITSVSVTSQQSGRQGRHPGRR